MAKLIKDNKHRGIYYFWCPGCKCMHYIATADNDCNFPIWGFNGDMEKPTVNTSICVTESWQGRGTSRCHSFVRDGKIQYLQDCTHELAGKTVPMVDWEDLDGEEENNE